MLRLALWILATSLVLSFDFSAGGAEIKILFVGNSFTFGALSRKAYACDRDAITDANGTQQGGVPGIFKEMTRQAGLDYAVTIEALPGRSLAYHLAHHAALIGSGTWDDIVLQGQSTEALPANRGGKPDAFDHAAQQIKDLAKNAQPATRLYLYETWARPDLVFPPGKPYAGLGLQAMQADLDAGYDTAATRFGFAGAARVGDAFLLAVRKGFANENPYHAPEAGKFELWNTDHYHGSTQGYYLAAAVIYATVTGLDPRQLAVGPASTAEGLGLGAAEATSLNQVAYEAARLPAGQPGKTGAK